MDIVLLRNCYTDYLNKRYIYNKMYRYYKGDSDAISNYKMVTERSNNKTPVNYIKKFVKEEVSYSIGNDINYISKSGNKKIIEDIDYYMGHWSKQHDSDLARKLLTYGFTYELYYIDNDAQFSSRIITPRNGYALTDDYGNIILFLHIFKKKFSTNRYIDVYDDKNIYHYDEAFNEISSPDKHIFGVVPVSIAEISEERENDTIYKDIKGLQDAYETNLSDISNEISDFRNAYLFISGFQIEEKDIAKMKELGVIQVTTKDGKATWLIKNINDSFIQNTLQTLEGKMYELTSHINHNEKMQSNVSGVALRSRLISLEEKCKLNQKAIADCILNRLKILFIYLKWLKKLDYDYRDIKLKFTPNIPQDDVSMADIISKVGDKMSSETALSLFSFIDSPTNELAKLKAEQGELLQGQSLLDDKSVLDIMNNKSVLDIMNNMMNNLGGNNGN